MTCSLISPFYLASPMGVLAVHSYNGEKSTHSHKVNYLAYPALLIIGWAFGILLQYSAEKLKDIYQDALKKEEDRCRRSRGPHAEIRLKRVWEEVLVKLNIPQESAKEKSEDILLIHRLYIRKKMC